MARSSDSVTQINGVGEGYNLKAGLNVHLNDSSESISPSLQTEMSHVNPLGLIIRVTQEKGRGVYATHPISAGTVIDIAPVLLFGPEEYESHAKHTVIDDYAFVWGDGRMALALGLGSILNHSETPNVSYSRDKLNNVIRFTTTKAVLPGDELLIFYGPNLWFPVAGYSREAGASNTEGPSTTTLNRSAGGNSDPWQILPLYEDEAVSSDTAQSSSQPATAKRLGEASRISMRRNRLSKALVLPGVAEGSGHQITIPPEELPLERFKFLDEEEAESDDGSILTMQVWAVTVQDMSKIGPMLEYLKLHAEAFEMDALKHLKRVRRVQDPETKLTSMSFAICPFRPVSQPPPFPTDLAAFHSEPFVVPVPATPATSPVQLERKSQLWPIAYFPTLEKGKKEKEWTRDELEWVKNGLRTCLLEARRVSSIGADHGNIELPIAAYVSLPFQSRDGTATTDIPSESNVPTSQTVHLTTTGPSSLSWIAHDTRQSACHPLRHACMNLIRHVAETQATTTAAAALTIPPSSSTPTTLSTGGGPSYLLTSQTLFTTHEPCIMCCMALLHSRVKDVFYVFPMRKTGGLGGGMNSEGSGVGVVKESVPGLKGVNHRYGIWRWAGDLSELGVEPEREDKLHVDAEIDI
ncbi:hypothetical protein FRB95_014220 [Tulasnella sp. JGI-2019a]|nr:hypothetical protein FRB95_014220 [Tulasnella sp. JGI-2019a]